MIAGYLYFINCRDYIQISLLCLMFKNNILDLPSTLYMYLAGKHISRSNKGIEKIRMPKRHLHITNKPNKNLSEDELNHIKNGSENAGVTKESFRHPNTYSVNTKGDEVAVTNVTSIQETGIANIPLGKNEHGKFIYHALHKTWYVSSEGEYNENKLKTIKFLKNKIKDNPEFTEQPEMAGKIIENLNEQCEERGKSLHSKKKGSIDEMVSLLEKMENKLENQKRIQDEMINNLRDD